MAATGKRYQAEQIVNKRREIDVLAANGKTIPEACKSLAISEQTDYRWRKVYGGLKVDQARRYKEIEAENARLKRLVAEISLREAVDWESRQFIGLETVFPQGDERATSHG
jgi:putative transposase